LGQARLKIALPLFHHEHLCIYPLGRAAAENQVDQHVEIAIDLLYFRLRRVDPVPSC